MKNLKSIVFLSIILIAIAGCGVVGKRHFVAKPSMDQTREFTTGLRLDGVYIGRDPDTGFKKFPNHSDGYATVYCIALYEDGYTILIRLSFETSENHVTNWRDTLSAMQSYFPAQKLHRPEKGGFLINRDSLTLQSFRFSQHNAPALQTYSATILNDTTFHFNYRINHGRFKSYRFPANTIFHFVKTGKPDRDKPDFRARWFWEKSAKVKS